MLRARQGLRPLCYNRAPFDPWIEMQDGWAADGRRNMVDVPFTMSQDCKAWAVSSTENPAVDSVPAKEGWLCAGCKHLPEVA